MIKALLKKQFSELAAFYSLSKKGKAGMILLFCLLFAVYLVLFVGLSLFLAEALPNHPSLYFAIMSLIALMLGVFLGVFSTYAGLYRAKDNELLLSLPVPPSLILFVRMIGVYVTGLLPAALVLLPAIFVFAVQSADLLSILFALLLIPFLGLVILSINCALGYLVAFVADRIRHKSFFAVLFTLGFLALYYLVYFRANEYLSLLSSHADEVEAFFRRFLFPLYAFGRGASGDLLAFLGFSACAALLSFLVWTLLSRTFLSLVTKKRGDKKRRPANDAHPPQSVPVALLRRELTRFFASPTYLLNCGLGIFILLLLSVLLFLRAGWVYSLVQSVPTLSDYAYVLSSAIPCMIAATNAICAPSISLEGNRLWILRSLPVTSKDILRAKRRLQTFLCAPPTLLCSLALCIATKVQLWESLAILLFCLLFVIFFAEASLLFGLLKPNLVWTNEAVPVKQSVGVLLSLLCGFLTVALFAASSLFTSFLGELPFLLFWCFLLAMGILLLTKLLSTKGVRAWEAL